MRVVVYDRTSGDEESTGQSPKEQLAMTVQLAMRAGHEVIAAFGDEDVPGDWPWEDRDEMPKARALAQREGAPVFVREVSRLWRGDPYEGMVQLRELSDIIVDGAPAFRRAAGVWERDGADEEWPRFAALQASWAEKVRVKKRTGQVMREIKDDRRATKSGRPPGRPEVQIDPAHVEAARAVYERDGIAAAHRRVLELRGYYATTDPRTQRKRFVGRTTVGRALGIYERVQNADASKTQAAPAGEVCDAKGPLVDGRSSA